MNVLASPAGLIVATDCGIAEALSGGYTFPQAVSSEAALDTAGRDALRTTN